MTRIPRAPSSRQVAGQHLDRALHRRSDLMTASLEGYAVLKVSGKGEGLDHLRQALSARFARRRRSSNDQTSEPAPEPVQ